MIRRLFIAGVVLATFSFPALAGHHGPKDIVDTAVQAGSFNTLVAALKAAGLVDALKGDDSVKIAGFGTYKVAKRKARVGRNPRTGEQIQIGASQKVKFLPAKALKEIFNK